MNVCNKSRRSGEIPNDQEKANAMPLRKGNKEREQRHYKLLHLTSASGRNREYTLLESTSKLVKEIKGVGKSQGGFTTSKSCFIGQTRLHSDGALWMRTGQ